MQCDNTSLVLALEWTEPEPVTEAGLARNISLRLETAEEEGHTVFRVSEVTAALQDRAYFNHFLNLIFVPPLHTGECKGYTLGPN